MHKVIGIGLYIVCLLTRHKRKCVTIANLWECALAQFPYRISRTDNAQSRKDNPRGVEASSTMSLILKGKGCSKAERSFHMLPSICMTLYVPIHSSPVSHSWSHRKRSTDSHRVPQSLWVKCKQKWNCICILFIKTGQSRTEIHQIQTPWENSGVAVLSHVGAPWWEQKGKQGRATTPLIPKKRGDSYMKYSLKVCAMKKMEKGVQDRNHN